MNLPIDSKHVLSRGIFWVTAESQDELDEAHIVAFAKPCNENCVFLDADGLNSADGTGYNHKASWATLPKSVTHGRPFDYYPRGRVEIRNGKATVWLNECLLPLSDALVRLFGLQSVAVTVRVDGSKHYMCHFDK